MANASKSSSESEKRPWIVINGPLFPPMPPTTSVLAFGILGGVLMFTPMVALIGDQVPDEYQEAVVENLKLMRDALLLVLGYYFSKVVNAGENSMAVRAIQAAKESPPSNGPVPADAKEAAELVAGAAEEAADKVIRTAEDAAAGLGDIRK
jgi:hypothetical protein